MTFTYSATNLSTELAQVRRLIADVDSTDPLFTDEEVNFFISTAGSLYRAAAMAVRAIAASKVLLAKQKTVQTYSEGYGDIVRELLTQADTWERMATATAGTVSLTRVDGHSSTIAARTP